MKKCILLNDFILSFCKHFGNVSKLKKSKKHFKKSIPSTIYKKKNKIVFFENIIKDQVNLNKFLVTLLED